MSRAFEDIHPGELVPDPDRALHALHPYTGISYGISKGQFDKLFGTVKPRSADKDALESAKAFKDGGHEAVAQLHAKRRAEEENPVKAVVTEQPEVTVTNKEGDVQEDEE